MAEHSIPGRLIGIQREVADLPLVDQTLTLNEVPIAGLRGALERILGGPVMVAMDRVHANEVATAAGDLRTRLAAVLRGTHNPEAMLALSGLQDVEQRTAHAARATEQARAALDRVHAAIGEAITAASEAEGFLQVAASETTQAYGSRGVFDRQITVYLPVVGGM